MDNSLFFDEESAIRELQKRGYRITKEDYPEGNSVTKITDLIQFFYARRRYYNSDRKFPHSIDYSEDRNYVSSFIQSREKLGLDRKTALKECAQIIDALFKYEKLLHLKEPVVSTVILTVRPIMDRVCSFMNGEVGEANDLDAEILLMEWGSYYNKHYSDRDRNAATENRKKILEIIGK